MFTDVEDGSALTYTIESNTNTGLVTPTIVAADSTLDLSFTASTTGTATITIRATDSGSLFVDDVFTVTVNGTPTVASAIADTVVTESNPPIVNYRDLKAVFTDVEDGSALTYTIQSNTNSGLVTPTIVAADSTLDLSFTASTSGTATITIRATDSGSSFVDDVFTVTVNAAVNLNVALVCGTVACADANLDVPLVNHLTSTLGHTVTNFDDADQAWTPTSYDVVVISESVGSSNNAWLKAQAVGILTVEGSNWDELEMGSAGGASGGADTQINITDNTHYITSVFTTGVRAVTTVTTNLGSMSGWANGVGKLAHYNSNSTLAKLLYVDIGGVLQGGINTAADRRAFWGAQYFANLTADGITIFNRALDWVAYNTAVNTWPTVAAAIADTTVVENNAPIDNYRDLKAVFTDVEDGSALTYSIESNTNSGLVTPTIVAADSTLDLSFTASTSGTATITVRATDSGSLFVDDVFTVTVNDSPTVASAIADTTVAENSAAIDNYRDLKAVFTDAQDGSGLTYTIQSNTNTGLVTASIIPADSTLDLSFTASTTGTATITIRATDSGALFVDDVFTVTVTDQTAPDAVANLATGTVTAFSVQLSWTAPGDDAAAGTATTYDVRYSDSTITTGNWGLATPASGEPSPQVAGSSESFTVTGLLASTTYYFAIKTSDEVPNESAISNVASVATSAAVGTILLVIPNAASLTPQDSTKKAWMESWSYTVALISANDTQGNFVTRARTASAASECRSSRTSASISSRSGSSTTSSRCTSS